MMLSYDRFIIYLFFASIFFNPIKANIPPLPATFAIDFATTNYKNPLLISTIGGLGAKLPLAQRMHKNETIGFDLVAHCVNELIAQGAQPLFFSTYFATNGLESKQRELFKGITTACMQSKCILKSNHPSEMKKLFHENQYDIGGFALGVIERDHLVSIKETIAVGDLIIGLTTSGIHASSFSKIESFIDYYNMDITVQAPFITLHTSLADAILAPITMYSDALLSPCKQQYIKVIAHVAQGGLENAIARNIPSHLKAKLELYRWSVPPLFRWIKQIAKYDVAQMAQEFNLGFGMLCIIDPRHANTLLTTFRTKKINAIPIGVIEQRSSDTAPIHWVGTIGTSYSRVLVIGDGAQDHAFAWKLAQSPYIERVFIAPGNGGTSTEQKGENLLINPHHHGALIAYIQQNNIDLAIITTPELLGRGIVDEFCKANIACIGPTKKSTHLAMSPEYAHDFMQRYAIPAHTSTIQGTPLSFSIMTDGTTIQPLTSCQQYKKRYNNDEGPDTPGMGVCCPAPRMTQTLQNRIIHEIIEPTLYGLKNEDAPLCGFLAVDLIITQDGDPKVVSFHFNLGHCEASAMMMRLQTDFFKLCYATCHKQLNLINLVWDEHPTITVTLLDNRSEQRHEIIVGLPEDNVKAKVFHMHTIHKDGKYQTNGIQPLLVTTRGETLEKARNNAYKLIQQIYWPSIEYRKDIGYREIIR